MALELILKVLSGTYIAEVAWARGNGRVLILYKQCNLTNLSDATSVLQSCSDICSAESVEILRWWQ